MDDAKKAKINKIIKKIKRSRAKSKAKAQEPQTAQFPYQVNSLAERTMIALGLAAGMAIIFDDSRKRAKHPEKARPFITRVRKNYGLVGSMIDSTVAKQLQLDAAREYTDEALEKMQIEDAIKFDL